MQKRNVRSSRDRSPLRLDWRTIRLRQGYGVTGKTRGDGNERSAGMRRPREERTRSVRATTLVWGEMILNASEAGAEKIIIGLGGSATNDGGFGMARNLASGFSGEDEEILQFSILRRFNESKGRRTLLFRTTTARLTAKSVARRNGATRVFGPQKGRDVRKDRQVRKLR